MIHLELLGQVFEDTLQEAGCPSLFPLLEDLERDTPRPAPSDLTALFVALVNNPSITSRVSSSTSTTMPFIGRPQINELQLLIEHLLATGLLCDVATSPHDNPSITSRGSSSTSLTDLSLIAMLLEPLTQLERDLPQEPRLREIGNEQLQREAEQGIAQEGLVPSDLLVARGGVHEGDVHVGTVDGFRGLCTGRPPLGPLSGSLPPSTRPPRAPLNLWSFSFGRLAERRMVEGLGSVVRTRHTLLDDLE